MQIELIQNVKPSFLSKFDCGIEELNTYLKRYAKKNDKLGVGRTYVLMGESLALGYYTIGMSQVKFDSLPEKARRRIPKYPLPAVRVGKLAVS